MKVFAISHSSVVDRFRRKWDELAGFSDVDLSLLVPRSWPEGGRRVAYTPCRPASGYRIIGASVLFRGIHALHFYPMLAYHLWRSRPEILHVEEEPWNVVTFQAACLGKLLGARVIVFTWENVRRWYPPPLPVFRNVVLRLADHAIAGNREGRDLLRERGFHREIDVLPQYGIDLPPDPWHARPPGGPFTVGFVGRLISQKGLDTLVDALSRLRPDARLLVVGDGPYRSSLAARAEALGVAERVDMVGSVPHEAVQGYLRRMHVLVLPSLTTARWKEQFGRVLVEGMALGVPVVGSDSGEIPSVIGDAGFVFPEGNSLALRDRLRELLEDESLRRDLAERGRARAVSCFSNRFIAERTHAIYRRVLRGG